MAHEKKLPEENRNRLRKGFELSGGVTCRGCFQKKIENDELKLKIVRLQQRVRQYEKVTQKDVSNTHTPSSRIDFKKNSIEDHRQKKGGAKKGHKGFGRKSATEETADRVIDLFPEEEVCPNCRGKLCRFDERDRTVIEAMPVKAKRVLYHAKRLRCNDCHKLIEPKPKVLPRFLYGNQLMSQAAVMHYVHGVPIGRVLEIFGAEVTEGGLIQAFHSLGKYIDKAIPSLIEEYRVASVRHADETGWRTDGHSGYAWLFATNGLSILEFADNRSARVPSKIFGSEPLRGVLVVDRYNGYNKMPVALQYCYAHLLREIEKLETDYSADKEVAKFSSTLIPLLTQAIKLRGLELSSKKYYSSAKQIKKDMLNCLEAKYLHLGIQKIQQIFKNKKHRLYHWVKNKEVPTENNMAERELRPTVIARKVSFGSQSDSGAKTRGRMMTVLLTAKKRLPKETPIEDWFKDCLDKLAANQSINIYDLLPRPKSKTTKD